MRKLIISVLIAVMCCSTLSISGQTTKKPVAKKPAKPAVVNTKPAEPPIELTIQLVNDCKHNQMVYAGPKKDIFHGKYQELGGVSTNTIYVKSGDVVCIMKDKTVKACADTKRTTSKIEINESGTGFVK